MLTQDQLNQLEPLTQHPKFGQLLKDAIEIWKREDVTPVYGDFGLKNINEKDEKWELDERKCCCLIGAAVTNTKIQREYDDWIGSTLTRNYHISDGEAVSLWKGFDGRYVTENFGHEVRNIIKPISIIDFENLISLNS